MEFIKKEKFKEIFLKKTNASTVVSDMIPVLITIIITGVMALCYISWISMFETKEHIDSIAREYVLKMGTVGYLTLQDRALLLQELQAQNLENISLQGTTENKVESGETVTLKISGYYKYTEIKMKDIFSWDASTDYNKNKLEIERCTTAIY